MENRHRQSPFPFHPLTANFGNASLVSRQGFHRRCPRHQDNFGIDHANLFEEVGLAGSHFCWRGGAVGRRPAIHRIADVDIAIGTEFNGGEDFFQQVSRPSHKRFTLLVFILPRSFPDNDDIRLGIAPSHHGIDARFPQPAAMALAAVNSEFVNGFVGSGGDGNVGIGGDAIAIDFRFGLGWRALTQVKETELVFVSHYLDIKIGR